jgi:hypothetical protein
MCGMRKPHAASTGFVGDEDRPFRMGQFQGASTEACLSFEELKHRNAKVSAA